MDKFGLRKDQATVKLFDALLSTSGFGIWLTLFPLYVLKKTAGENLIYSKIKKEGNESLANLVTSRTVYFDELLNKSFKTTSQLVVMGSSFDTRCYGSIAENDIPLFE